MMRVPVSGRTQAAASALAIGVVGIAAGGWPLAGLSFVRPAAAAAPAPARVPVQVVEPVAAEELPADLSAARDPFHIQARLGQTAVLRGDGRVDLVVDVGVGGGAEAHRPVDLALVVDTSASMAPVMGLVRRATLGALDRLGPGRGAADDRLVLVSYSDDARVLFDGEVGPDARPAVGRAVAGFVPSRGTNIGDAVTLALARLGALAPRPGAARRLVLISDGAPTVGETDPRALVALAARARAAGVGLSTIGLGPDYAEGLLADLADQGGGAFHQVDHADALAACYADELEALRGVALRGATLVLRPGPGVTVDGVAGWQVRPARDGVAVDLGDLAADDSVRVVAHLRVTPGADPTCRVASVGLAGDTDAGSLDLATGDLGVRVVGDPTAAAASASEPLRPALVRAAAAEALGAARQAASRGDAVLLAAALERARALGGDDLLAAAGGLDAVARALAGGPETEAGRRALKRLIAAERSAAREVR
jgi:Mg-chelatase subunit ChlD